MDPLRRPVRRRRLRTALAAVGVLRRRPPGQAAPQRGQARLQAVCDASPAGIVGTDLQQRIVHANAAFSRLAGVPAADLLGRRLGGLLVGDGTAFTSADHGPVGGAGTRELLRRPDGSELAVLLDREVVLCDDGRPVELVYVVTDVSAQAAVEAELQHTRSRAEALWAQAPVGIIEVAPDGRVCAVNAALLDLLGHREQDLVGRPGMSLAEPALIPEITEAVAALRGGRTYRAERRYLAADGSPVAVEVATAVPHNAAGNVDRMAAFVVDTTAARAQHRALETAVADLAEAHDELARRQCFTDALLETIDVGIVSCDADGRVLVRNRAERALLGLPGAHPGADGAGLPVFDVRGVPMPLDDQPLSRALRGDDVGAVELRLGAPGGGQREVVARARRITGDDGVVLGAVAAVADVTAERAGQQALAEERRLLTEAQRLGRLGSFTYDPQGDTYTYSAQTLLTWGVRSADELDALAGSLVHEDDRVAASAAWAGALATGGQHSYAHRIRRPDGQVRYLRVTVEVELDAAGRAVHLHGTAMDVSELTEAERRAHRASAQFEAILAASPDFTFIIDLATGTLVYGSPGKDLCGHSTQRLAALGALRTAELVHRDDRLRLRAVNVAAGDLEDGQVLQVRYRLQHADGRWCWLNRRVTPFRRDGAGAVVEVLGVLRDVSDVVAAEERLTHSALHDPLTELPNRALLLDRLDAALHRARQRGREVAVLFCDLDGFKRVNDTAGHAAGDTVLRAAAARLQAVVRDQDTVARVGGDEFVLVVEPWDRDSPTGPGPHSVTADRDLAVSLAERVAAALRRPVVVQDVEHMVTASIGITYAGGGTTAAPGPVTADEVLRDADAAMYRAKHRGKDRFEVFEHGLWADLAERGRVEQALRRALGPAAGGRPPARAGLPGPRPEPAALPAPPTLTAAYQPVVDGATGVLVGFEALARLRTGDGAHVAPDVFIAVAEDTGQIHELGARMLTLACAQLAAWRRQTPQLATVTMAVNLSALQAQHGSLGDQVRAVIAGHGLAPHDLVLELTETALLQAAGSTIDALRRLRADGVGIAIDDFGVGYASLRYLVTLPVSAVKVDRSFTAGLPHDRTCRKIVHAVAGLAADLDLICVVEGVETEEQRHALPPGVQVQGWLTGRPHAGDELRMPAAAVPLP